MACEGLPKVGVERCVAAVFNAKVEQGILANSLCEFEPLVGCVHLHVLDAPSGNVGGAGRVGFGGVVAYREALTRADIVAADHLLRNDVRVAEAHVAVILLPVGPFAST